MQTVKKRPSGKHLHERATQGNARRDYEGFVLQTVVVLLRLQDGPKKSACAVLPSCGNLPNRPYS